MAREAAGRRPAADRTPLAWAVLLPALILGVLADVVLRAGPPGFGVLVWTAAFVGTGAGLVWWRRQIFRGVAWWLPPAAMATAAALAWRDSSVLKALDLLVLAIVGALTAIRTPVLRLRLVWLTDLVLAATVLRGRPEPFVFGALLAGLLAIALLHLLNPDALIARANLARAAESKPVDTRYLSRLSADAVPVLVDALPTLSEPERCELARTLRLRWSGAADDWRSWSISRARAERSVASVPPC